MKPKPKIDLDKVAQGLGAVREGYVYPTGGYFGAAQLVSDVQERFRAPARGGRSTDPEWTERRLIPVTPETLLRLERLAERISARGTTVTAFQVAALLLEKAVADSEAMEAG